ncbi:MAG: hypothetical protein B7Y62_06770 [Sphingomonadales bacterium 35-56-22]|jgi:hypothetical protein|nr:MAG: hypothetical protein B7Y62_06770 [Sphingomonadales bacterium 35-56-22]OYY97192.1 MAG: hypothetical protein B7Y38_08830 [Sphingomonadales bacterium 28-56-43]OYZ60224.1 MAG: hypothetical protein B7Y10_07375 [Sphingomonadales bacterium 24-56-14]OZA82815.1 MAG: hypothetical protein B7X66_06065 [Sphingomonadales bacterium 39-57-19]
MTNNYLRWRGVQAALELALSPNSKVVLSGNDKSGGMPLTFDGSDCLSGTMPRKSRTACPKPHASNSGHAPPLNKSA